MLSFEAPFSWFVGLTLPVQMGQGQPQAPQTDGYTVHAGLHHSPNTQ